ncbi:MAG: hypothetical protein HC830_08795 [Bacteroidetes bacterium]|nr:hypothetical protein [Bacteroidota bacterium]
MNLETFQLNELKRTGELKVIRKNETVMPVEEYPDSLVINKGSVMENLEMGVEFGKQRIWINVTAAPMPDRDEVIVAFMDITDQILREKQIE